MDVEISDRVPRFDSKTRSLSLFSLFDEDEIATFDGGRIENTPKLLGEFENQDPDLLITNGNSFVLRLYLSEKARRHSVALELNRDESCENYNSNRTTGKTYFSYGQGLDPQHGGAYGRLHLDEENTFACTTSADCRDCSSLKTLQDADAHVSEGPTSASA